MNRRIMAFAGVVWFALILAALEYARNGQVSWLPVRTVAIAAVTVAIALRLKPARWCARTDPRSFLFPTALFVLLTSHLMRAVGEECLRAFRAWRFTVGSPRSVKGRWVALISLSHALAAILSRSLARAERVYAALAVSGVAR